MPANNLKFNVKINCIESYCKSFINNENMFLASHFKMFSTELEQYRNFLVSMIVFEAFSIFDTASKGSRKSQLFPLFLNDSSYTLFEVFA